MKLGAARKPIPPKTKEQKEKEQQQVSNNIPNQNEDIEKLAQEIQKVYGNWFLKEDILKELEVCNLNKSTAISNLIKRKEQIEKLEEKLAAQKIQQASTSNTQKEQQQTQFKEMVDLFGFTKQNQKNIDIKIPSNLLKEIQQNFSIPKQD